MDGYAFSPFGKIPPKKKGSKMKDEDFKKIEPQMENIYDRIHAMLTSADGDRLKEMMQKLSAELPDHYELLLNAQFEVFDTEREATLPLISEAISVSSEQKPLLSTSDSTIHRYVVEGAICHAPNDYCPKCWGEWAFKVLHKECPHCGCQLGKEVKLLLDSDVCPHCERGKVSASKPKCSDCGFEIDPDLVVWG
jgi:hypothetical protein